MLKVWAGAYTPYWLAAFVGNSNSTCVVFHLGILIGTTVALRKNKTWFLDRLFDNCSTDSCYWLLCVCVCVCVHVRTHQYVYTINLHISLNTHTHTHTYSTHTYPPVSPWWCTCNPRPCTFIFTHLHTLLTVVYHHGKSATGGHYTADVFHPACSGWVRADDSIIRSIPEDFVLKPGGSAGVHKVAYLLIYRRRDTIV